MEFEMWKCNYCRNEFDFSRTTEKGNHAKHCEQNPNRKSSYEKLSKSSDKRFGAFIDFSVFCYACSNVFNVKEREKLFPSKSQYFCSRSCSNSIGGKAKSEKYHTDDVARYTTVAWRHHERKCLVCSEINIVAVHHLNGNHADNRPENLVPLCPTHHQYMHSRHKYLIENMVLEYIKNWVVLNISMNN
jgi:hypothetical protein